MATIEEALARARVAEKLADKAFDMAKEALVKVSAMEKSTHKIIAVDPYKMDKNGSVFQSEEEMNQLLSEEEYAQAVSSSDPMGEFVEPKAEVINPIKSIQGDA